MKLIVKILCIPGLLLLALQTALANDHPPMSLIIPRLDRAPAMADFLNMQPSEEMRDKLARVTGFIQREPSDGQPSSQRTEVYLGYDDRRLYVIFVAFDSEPEKVRARLTRREDIRGDDRVEVMLDTFNDQRRAIVFTANPFGIQRDALWTEGGNFNFSFDTVWHSSGRLTDQGYVVLMELPLKSLRFGSETQQSWGIILRREIPRNNEEVYWPRVSNRIEGRLNQAALLTGLNGISPGRNVQIIPYGVFRSFRALDDSDETGPRFISENSDFDGGIDAKIVLKDSLALDITINPDFSQIESDQPQVTVNRRFEVFFPERRPFFLENANLFSTPIDNVIFTRRIADPQFGVRLTGKTGPYAIGAFLIDDQAPGRSVSPEDPLFGKRALFGVARITRDILDQSSISFLYARRQFAGDTNQVSGLDGRWKLNQNWTVEWQAIGSRTLAEGEDTRTGAAYDFELERSGRQFRYTLEYNDRSPDFIARSGFIPRTDIRRIENSTAYTFRPAGKFLIAWRPELFTESIWDYSGTRLDWTLSPSFDVELIGQTFLSLFASSGRERLRPVDFSALPENRDYPQSRKGFFFRSSYFPAVTVRASYSRGNGINFSPPDGRAPVSASRTNGNLNLTLRPFTPLRIDNTYIFTGLTDPLTDATIFNNHIIRSRWNWQLTRELSLRFIAQYNTLLPNRSLTSLEKRKNINADFLLTYQVNAWTALFVGYNSNGQNINLIPGAGGQQLVRTDNRFINDGRQLFVKFSYLFRF